MSSSSSHTKTNYAVEDPITHGLRLNKDVLQKGHPLEESEKNFFANEEKAMMNQLRSVQGLHAPLKIQMEKHLVSKAGHLPCISQRSNLLLDVLNGRDDAIDFDDVFGKPEDCERGLGLVHNTIERHFERK